LSFDPIGKPKYMIDNMFVMCHNGKYELTLGINVDEIRVNNKMHACYKFKVEWGIGGFKHKWGRFMKWYDSTKSKYNYLFRVVVLLTNFLHIHYQDLKFKVISNHLNNSIDHDWDDEY
jgi:hypothetical protein